MFMHYIKSCQCFEAPSRRHWCEKHLCSRRMILFSWAELLTHNYKRVFLVWTTVYNINTVYHTCPSPHKTLDLNRKQENCSIKQICQHSDGDSPVQRGWRRLVRFKSYSTTLTDKTKRRRRNAIRWQYFPFSCPDVNSSLKRSLNAS